MICLRYLVLHHRQKEQEVPGVHLSYSYQSLTAASGWWEIRGKLLGK